MDDQRIYRIMFSDFTIVGDPHLTHKSLEKGKKLFTVVEELGKPAIWLGDLLDTKEIIRGICQNAYYDYFKTSSLQHIIIVGNHDWFNLECEDHSLRVFEALENVMIVDSLEEIAENCYAMPYIHDKEEVKKILKKVPKDAYLIGHFEMSSFDYGNGRICDDGMDMNPFKKFKHVISGHFHKYQHKDNFTYLGSPFSHTFGESNQEKYLGIMKDGQLELMKTDFPRHLTGHAYCDTGENQILFKGMPNLFVHKDDLLRVVLEGKQENINVFPRGMFESMNKIRWIERPTDIFNQDVQIDDTSSNINQFIKWANEIQGLDDDTTKLGTQILEALNGK